MKCRNANVRYRISLLFASCVFIQVAVAQQRTIAVNVAATASLLLADVSAGTRVVRTYSDRDQAPANSAVEIRNVTLTAGALVKFSVTGTTTNGSFPTDLPRRSDITGEGYVALGNMTASTDYGTDETRFGMGKIIAPINSLIGVFLPDAGSPAGQPPPLGPQITSIQRAEIVQRPQLRQPFFIGIGMTPDGTSREVYAPIGATRLFLWIMSQENASAVGLLRVVCTVSPAPAADSATVKAANLSTRVHVGTGANAAIVGLGLKGAGTKSYLIRAVGPGLREFGLTGLLPTPRVSVFNAVGVRVADFAGWDPSLSEMFTSVGAFPLQTGNGDAAAVMRLAEGNYTFVISSEFRATNRPPVQQEGIALVEVYELP